MKTKRESTRPSLICRGIPDLDQPAEMAETGHEDSQAPQSMQVSASITYWLAPAEIAPVGTRLHKRHRKYKRQKLYKPWLNTSHSNTILAP